VNDIRKRLDFHIRAMSVFEAIAAADKPVTMMEVAERAGLTRSPYLREVVDTLYSRGYIRKGLDIGERGHAVVVYWAVQAPDWST